MRWFIACEILGLFIITAVIVIHHSFIASITYIYPLR